MTTEQGKRVIESFYTAFNRADRDAYCALLHPDFRAEISGHGEVSGVMDREAFARMVFERVGQIFPGGLEVTVQEQIAEADRIASRVVVSGRTQSGRAYSNPACHVFRVRDGRVVEIVEYFDTALSRAAFEEAARA